MMFTFGKQARDYMVGLHPFALHLRTVGEIFEGQYAYVVLADPAGNHYARNTSSAAPVLVRVYPVEARVGA